MVKTPKMIYGLIGKSLSHSFSARYFNNKFGIEHINAEYCLFPIPDISYLKTLILSTPGLMGLNVTIPYKKEVIPLLDSVSDEAAEIGAVNVIKICRNQDDAVSLHGYNTDITGFKRSIAPLVSPKNKKALILGTGGASNAVAYALKSFGVEYTKVSRSAHPDDASCVTYKSLSEEDVREHKIIVNATPLGTWPDIDTCPQIPYEGIGSEHLAFDLVYNPEVTAFMHRCAQRGAMVKNGEEMLRLQAEEAWKIFGCRQCNNPK